MATTIRELIAKLGVEADEGAVKKFDAAVGAVKDTLLAAAAAAAAVTAAVVAVTAATAAYGDEAAKGAQSTGLNVEAYQELQFASEKAGLSQEQFKSAMQAQARAAETAAESNEGYIETANGTRIAVKDANGEMKTQEQLLKDTAKAVSAATTEQEKLAIATAVYGRAGAEMLPLLNAGTEGIEELREQAQALGLVMSEDAAKASEQFNDSITDLKAILTGLRNEIGTALMPILTDVAERIRDWYVANKEIINQRLDEYVGYIVDGIGWLVGAAETLHSVVMNTFGSWVPVLTAIGVALGSLLALLAVPTIVSTVSAIAGGISAIASIGLPAILAVAGAVASLIGYFAALGLIAEDVYTFFQGGDSVLGRLIEQYRGTETLIGSVIGLFEQMIPLLSQLWTLVQTVGEVWWFVFSNTTLPILQVLAEALMFVGGILLMVFGEYLQFVIGNFTLFAEWLTNLLTLINQFIAALSNAETAAAAIGGAIGGALGGFGIGGAVGELFAPSAEAAEGGTATSTSNTSIGGNTYNITGVGMSAEETQAMIDAAEEAKNRSVSEQLAGSEV